VVVTQDVVVLLQMAHRQVQIKQVLIQLETVVTKIPVMVELVAVVAVVLEVILEIIVAEMVEMVEHVLIFLRQLLLLKFLTH
jgi:hypothetical protein|tara:strand:+ start:540 stop:785 length:246 start_codon:yes stop_codon:yes gene_type:complete